MEPRILRPSRATSIALGLTMILWAIFFYSSPAFADSGFSIINKSTVDKSSSRKKVTKKVEDAVSFFANVDPDSFDTTFAAIVIGTEQATAEDLNELLRPSGGMALRVTTMKLHNFTPVDTSYASVFLGACTPIFSTRGFGSGPLAAGGPNTIQVNFQPGLVATLNSNESLCIRSLIQSNDLAVVGIHGFLQNSP